ncbi:MAG: ABC transporter substrate-binding protein [Propionibacteriaceae bacterium]|nr:ABC transporter substrate-binding protein [Propionibacteriaceae bacterium]
MTTSAQAANQRTRHRPVILFSLVTALFALVLSGCSASGTRSSAPESGASNTIRVASLKGPTTMGLVSMISDPDSYLGDAVSASFDMEGTADAITPKLVSGGIDVAFIPANLAAVLYSKDPEMIQVAAITTLNVLYVVTKGVDIESVDDLTGQIVYSTGLGTTPEAVLDTVLAAHNLSDQVHVRYLSEASEVAARLASSSQAIAVLPEPYVTAAMSKDPSIKVAIDLGVQFQAATGSPVVSGVAVVRQEYADTHSDLVQTFLKGLARSASHTVSSPDTTGILIADQGITPTPQIATQAIPRCSITTITGHSVQVALDGYLASLYRSNPSLVGGTLPDSEFYWT